MTSGGWTWENASGPFSSSNTKEFHSLCADLGIDPSDTDRQILLFALQTYFALVVKLVSVVILEGTTGESLFGGLTGRSDIREALGDLEAGLITSSVGALNVIGPGPVFVVRPRG